MSEIIVIKLDHLGRETWRYSGRLLSRQAEAVVLEAFFNRPDFPLHGVLLRQGDRFVEKFYRHRWYNIFAVYDHEDDQLKCWYCNIARPAEFQEKTISYVDLALDLLVFPDGSQLVLDEDEFVELPLSVVEREHARSALAELQALFAAPVTDWKKLAW